MTGYDAKDIRDWLRNERKKERRRRGDNPDKNRSEQYRERKRSRERVEAWDELIARLLKDRPPDRDPAEHERIVRMNFADVA